MEKVEKETNNKVDELFKIIFDRKEDLLEEDYESFISMGYSLIDIIEILKSEHFGKWASNGIGFDCYKLTLTSALKFMCNYIQKIIDKPENDYLSVQKELAYIDLFLSSVSDFVVSYNTLIDDKAMFDLQTNLEKCCKMYNIDYLTIFEKGTDCNDDDLSLLTECSFDTLQKGDLFGIRAIDLLTINFYEEKTEDGCLYSFIRSSSLNRFTAFENTVLLFCYLGDDKCIELYTQKIVNIDKNNAFTAKTYCDNNLSLATKAFAAIQESPLVIDGKSNRKLFKFDEKLKEQLISQESKEDDRRLKIEGTIECMFEHYSNRNKNEIEALISRDYEEAEKVNPLETNIVSLKKVAKSIITGNQE